MKCTSCQRPNNNINTFCYFCGASLKLDDLPLPPAGNRAWRVLVAILSLFLAGLIFFKMLEFLKPLVLVSGSHRDSGWFGRVFLCSPFILVAMLFVVPLIKIALRLLWGKLTDIRFLAIVSGLLIYHSVGGFLAGIRGLEALTAGRIFLLSFEVIAAFLCLFFLLVTKPFRVVFNSNKKRPLYYREVRQNAGTSSLRFYSDDGRLTFEVLITKGKQGCEVTGIDPGGAKLFFMGLSGDGPQSDKVFLYETGELLGSLHNRLETNTDAKRWIFYNKDKSLKEGDFKEYYASGKLMYEGHCQKGVPYGCFNCYDRDGRLQDQRNYLAGQLDGFSKKFYKSGDLMVRTMFKKGIADGESCFYAPAGGLYIKSIYEAGKFKRNYMGNAWHAVWSNSKALV